MKTNATVEIMDVSPEIASEWLSDMWDGQRMVRKTHIERLVSDMQSGRFSLSPDAILRVNGKLANGQHRLRAVMKSGKSQPFLVMTSDDAELYKVIDAGIKRTVADGLVGVLHGNESAAIARLVMAYQLNAITVTNYSGGKGVTNVSQAEMINYCIANASIIKNAEAFVRPLYGDTRLLTISISGSLHTICASCKEGVCDFLRRFPSISLPRNRKRFGGNGFEKSIDSEQRGTVKTESGLYIRTNT